MTSEHYPYKVAAVYPDAAAAEAAVQTLKSSDLGDIRIFLLDSATKEVDLAIEPEPLATRQTVVKETVAGGAAGTAAGAVATGATVLAAHALFVAAPVVGPLVVLGYGAMIGGTVGAIHGLRLSQGRLAGLVKDTLEAGYSVVIIHAPHEETERRVRDVIQSTMVQETSYT